MNEQLNRIIQAKEQFLNMYAETQDDEIKEMVNYIKKYDRFYMMNCDLFNDYKNYEVSIALNSGFPYVMWNGKRVYFPKKYSESEIKMRFCSLIREQDYFSPHKYLDDRCLNIIRQAKLQSKKIVVIEIGAMEGMFSLQLSNIADEMYIFECDNDWCDALHRTLTNTNAKIINKFLENKLEQGIIKIDDMKINVDNSLLIVKMDIEGSEYEALKGMKNTLENADEFLSLICVYHKQNNQQRISEMFSNQLQWYNRGYFCFFVADDYEDPYIRRCVLKVYNESVGNEK